MTGLEDCEELPDCAALPPDWVVLADCVALLVDETDGVDWPDCVAVLPADCVVAPLTPDCVLCCDAAPESPSVSELAFGAENDANTENTARMNEPLACEPFALDPPCELCEQ